MDKSPTPSTLVEEMGLRREDTTRLGLLDLVLVLALVVSGVTWIWVSLIGIAPDLLAALGSPAGRLGAALIGLASVAAVIRAFLVSRWPVTDNERSLL